MKYANVVLDLISEDVSKALTALMPLARAEGTVTVDAKDLNTLCAALYEAVGWVGVLSDGIHELESQDE
jgi:hypothetical protein